MKATYFNKIETEDVQVIPEVVTNRKFQFGALKYLDRDLTLTLPKVRTLYSGCKYNKIALTSTPELTAFVQCLEGKLSRDGYNVTPNKHTLIRLSVPPFSVLVDAKTGDDVDVNDLKRNTLVTPVVRFGYYVHGKKLGLVCTLIKAFVHEKIVERIVEDVEPDFGEN